MCLELLVLRKWAQSLSHGPSETRVGLADLGMQVNVLQQGVAQRQVLGINLVEEIRIFDVIQTRSLVAHVVGLDASLPREFILDAEVPILHVRQPLNFGKVVRNVLTVEQSRVRVGQRLTECRIRTIPIVARILLEATRSQDYRIGAVETLGIRPTETVADGRTEVDSIATTNYRFLARCISKAESGSELLVVGLCEVVVSRAAWTVTQHYKSTLKAVCAWVGHIGIKSRHPVRCFLDGLRNIPPESQVEGQIGTHLP